MKPNWAPFTLADAGKHGDAPRAIETVEGIGDRLRAAAFAELQAREAFNWAADTFTDVPEELRRAWRMVAAAEEKHLNWLLARLQELGMDPAARRVSDFLWDSFMKCETGRDFALYMASAEERGRKAGIRFSQAMAAHDPISAKIFGKIAEEEQAHIDLAEQFFPGQVETYLNAKKPNARLSQTP